MDSIRKNKYYRSYKGTVLGGLLGFMFWTLLSHPKSKVNKKMPSKRIKNFHISPQNGAYVKYYHKDKAYQLHHWLTFTALYVTMLGIRRGIMKSKFLNGLFLGSILQGFIYHDRFKLIQTLEELAEQEQTSYNLTPVK